MLPLDLVQEIEVALVEVVHADVTILSSRCVALASGVCCDGVLSCGVLAHVENRTKDRDNGQGRTKGPK